jgi:FkbM family methyltransferase
LTFDILLKKYLYDIDGKPFHFIQIGSYDGIMHDPLFPFLRNNIDWHGKMLEPQMKPYSKLKELYKNHPNISVLNYAIAQNEGKKLLYSLDGEGLPEWTNELASFIKDNILAHEKWIPNIESYIVENEVSTISFNNLLQDIHKLDLLLTDTEGFDGEIIRMFPFVKLKPKIIRFESKHLKARELDEILELLHFHGYVFAKDGDEDTIALLNNLV